MIALEKSNRVYPTDMTDAQWEIIRPMLPLSPPIGADRGVDMRKIINGPFHPNRTEATSIGRAVNGECCPRNTNTGIPLLATTVGGVKTAHGNAFTMHCEKKFVVKTVASRHPALRSSTVSRSKRPKKRGARL